MEEPAALELSTKSGHSLPTELPMQESATSPGPPTLSGNSQITRSEQGFSTDVKLVPERPLHRASHHQAHSKIAFHLLDDTLFEQEFGSQGTESPILSDYVGEDILSMHIDMEKYKPYHSSSRSLQGLKGDESYAYGTAHHSHSLSVDGSLSGFNGNRDLMGTGAGQLNVRCARHQRSSSMDGAISFKKNLLTDNQGNIEPKNALAASKLAELSLVDKKQAKRILANRQSAARSKERKMRYIFELEQKVQTLQTEATTLSAQLVILQRDTTGFSTENKELKLRLQAVQQQGQLRDALNEALTEEVQRHRSAIGQWMQSGVGSQEAAVDPHVPHHFTARQLEQFKQAQTAFSSDHFFQQNQGYSGFLRTGISGSVQGIPGNFGESFIRSEACIISVSQKSSTSFWC